MDIRKIIRNELRKIINENYPLGAKEDPDAPWNRVDNIKKGEKPGQIKYDVVWSDNVEMAILKDGLGKMYVFATLSNLDKKDLEPYADREQTYIGRDEEGFADFEYGEWDVDYDVIENYINDNYDSMNFGFGLDDYESGDYDIIELDEELRKDLLGISKYIKNDKDRNSFISIISGVKINENDIVDTETMQTPTGTIFSMNISENEYKKNNKRRG